MLAITGFGWMRQGLVVAPLLAAALSFVVLMLWKDVGFHEWAMDERGFWSTVPGLIQPPRFCNAMFLALFAFGAVGAYGVMRKAEPRPWAALVAGAAFLFLFGAWARADFTQPDTLWAVLGAGLSAALAGLAFLHRKSLDSLAENLTENLTEKLAWRDAVTVLLGGAALLALFALDRLLNGVWLTLAIAVLATSYAFATRTFPIGHIGFMASTMATLAAARLFVGREFWGEPTNVPLGAHWVVYGYGIPAVLFWQASRWLKGDDFARWRVALEGLSLGLLISLVSLELRVLIGGGITSDDMGLLELSAHALSWLGAAYGLAYRQQLYSSLVSLWGARVLLAAACAAFVLCLTLFNPVFSGDAVAGGQIINALWLAYLAPVALLAIMARKLEGLGLAKFRTALGVFALVLLISFITLWTKRQFQDATLVAEFESQAESYTTSLAWLISGIGIFIAGLKLERAPIRYGGLAILILAVLKVFGIDLFSLGGLWRIGSIVGLGACLIGVGWLYTRYIGMAATKKPELEI